MKLKEMGVFGHDVKISEKSPHHGGEVGRIIDMTMERLHVEFKNGDQEWIPLKYVVGTRKPTVEDHNQFDEYLLSEESDDKVCPKCKMKMAGNHYWKDGDWNCKSSKHSVPPSPPRGEFPYMSDDEYDKLDAIGQAEQDVKEKRWFLDR